MTRTIAGGLAAGALVVTALTLGPAAARRETPTYTCDYLSSSQLSQGVSNCEASEGAVIAGPFRGETVLRDRESGAQVLCHGSGVARVPSDVQADDCDANQT